MAHLERQLTDFRGTEMPPILEQIRDTVSDVVCLIDFEDTSLKIQAIADGVIPLRADIVNAIMDQVSANTLNEGALRLMLVYPLGDRS